MTKISDIRTAALRLADAPNGTSGYALCRPSFDQLIDCMMADLADLARRQAAANSSVEQ